MGLAAGQARLLSITARLSDNEHSSQSLAYAKQRLADSAQQITTEYNEALDATKLTVLTGFNGSVPNYTDISYGLMTGLNTVACGKQYVVTDNKGKILVPKSTAKAFENSVGDINEFLRIMSVNGKTNHSQVDIDVTADNASEKVKEAWDKYFASINKSNMDYSIEILNDVELPCVKMYDGKPIAYKTATFVNGNLGIYFSQLPANTEIHLTQAIQNIDENGNKIINSAYLATSGALPMDLAIPTGKATTACTTNYEYNEIRFCTGGDLNNEIAPRENISGIVETNNWIFEYGGETYMLNSKPWLNKNNKVLYNDDGNYVIDYYLYKYNSTNNSWANISSKSIRTENIEDLNKDILVTNINTSLLQPLTVPINYDGTTQAQRELYDYAVALTRGVSYYAEYGRTDGSNSIAADPENADAVNYLKNIFYQMQTFGYVTSEEAFHLDEADSLHDNIWFEEQLKKGKLFLKSYSASEKTFMPTTLSDDSAIQEVEDERKIAMAEAKYTQDMEQLEREDQKFDLELKKLDTEHNALQTEYDALKSVVDKNIEKAFNAFS